MTEYKDTRMPSTEKKASKQKRVNSPATTPREGHDESMGIYPWSPGLTCPCYYTTPCDPQCTCVHPYSSRGCDRCCTYGSLDQRKANAERIAKALEAA